MISYGIRFFADSIFVLFFFFCMCFGGRGCILVRACVLGFFFLPHHPLPHSLTHRDMLISPNIILTSIYIKYFSFELFRHVQVDSAVHGGLPKQTTDSAICFSNVSS
jgi:hypothetical protein